MSPEDSGSAPCSLSRTCRANMLRAENTLRFHNCSTTRLNFVAVTSVSTTMKKVKKTSPATPSLDAYLCHTVFLSSLADTDTLQ